MTVLRPEVGPVPPEALRPSRWRRFVGNLFDALLILPAFLALDWMLSFHSYLARISLDFDSLPGSLYFGVVASCAFAVTNFWPLKTTQQTWAKRLLRMQIRTEHDQVPTLKQLLVRRYLWQFPLFSIPYVGPVLGLIDAVFIFNHTQQCAHDAIAETVVIQIRG